MVTVDVPGPENVAVKSREVARIEMPAPLRREVRLLGDLLGQVLAEFGGAGLLEDVEKLRRTVIANGNTFEVLMEAVRGCSLGEITHTLYDVGGRYRRNM